MQNRPILKLPNLGKTSERLLAQVGVHDEKTLRELGAVAVYCLVRAQDGPVSLNLLWAMHGALHDLKWTAISAETKVDLLAQVEAFRFG